MMFTQSNLFEQKAVPDVRVDESTDNETTPLDKEKPRGVWRIEAIVAQMSTTWHIIIYVGLFLVAYSITLNYLVTSTYLAYATSSWEDHSLLSTINVVRGVIAAAALPIVAKLSDIIGRFECFIIVSIFFVVGTIIQAAATTIQAFAVGALFTQIGYTSIQLVIEIFVADTTSLRSRLFFLFLPAFPSLINVWISGNITASVLAVTTWRWGYGMWAIIYPVTAIPLFVALVIQTRRTSKHASQDNGPRSVAPYTRTTLANLPSQLDLVGLFLLTASLSLLLLPLTLAGGETAKWKRPGIITPVVLGGLILPVFLFWEVKASHPIMPYALFKHRSVWAAIGISFFSAVTFTAQSEFLYTVLIVAYDFSISSATRVSVLSTFMEAAGGLLAGAIIYMTKRSKPTVLAGCVLWFIAYALMYRYRGSSSGPERAGIIAAQVLVGLSTACVSFPNIVIAMSVANHKDVALLTSLWLTMNWVGYAVGNCITGAIWTQVMYGQLESHLGPVNATIIDMVYTNPFSVVSAYPVGTPERTAIVDSYRYVEKLLVIVSMALVAPIVVFSICLKNPKLEGHSVGKA